MRFTNETGLIQALKYSSQRLTHVMAVPVTNFYRKLRRVFNPNGFVTQVMTDVQKGSRKLLVGQPQSLRDYISIGNYYIAKKLVFLAAVGLLLLPVLYLKFAHPFLMSHFFTNTMVINSAEMVGYTGKVRLLSGFGGTVLYQGPLREGRITGEGTLYDYSGNLLYQGNFLMEQYEGFGQTFWANGNTCYVGSFSGNEYSGAGKLYGETGALLYQGDFASGRYEGYGRQYSQTGVLLYDGSFLSGQYEGQGRQYDETGVLLYEGGFAAGVYDGEGTLYQNGEILYRGSFRNGMMEGVGTLFSGDQMVYEGGFSSGMFHDAGREYDPIYGTLLYDGTYVSGQYEGEGRKFHAETGNLIYEGGFYQGAYEGEGICYDPQTRQPLYEGGFRAGRYDGEGELYDMQAGVVVYRGGFMMGSYHGEGTVYDPATGFVAAAGQFRNGTLVTHQSGTLPGEGILPELPEIPALPQEPVPPADWEEPEGTAEPTLPEEPVTPDEPVVSEPPVQPEPPNQDTGAKIYHGPVTREGAVDVYALAEMSGNYVSGQFDLQPNSWTVSEGTVQVFEDKVEQIGVVLRTDKGGHTVGIDVWNDMPVDGAKTGMTKQQIAAALGQPKSTTREILGEGRMISVSQSNRYFGRLTNLSPESSVEVQTFEGENGTVRALFANGLDQCLMLEILP